MLMRLNSSAKLFRLNTDNICLNYEVTMENKSVSLFGKSFALPERFSKRLFMTIAGTVICAFAVGFFKCALFGVDPFQSFAQGIHVSFVEKFMSYGTYYMLISFVLLIADLFLDKSYIGIATLINLFLTGYIVDFSVWGIKCFLPSPNIPQRAVMLVIGVVVMCFASSLYMTSNLGVSVYDAIPIVISEKKKLPFKFCRIGTDLICVLIGAASLYFSGNKVFELLGIGTIITAFFMGPLIEFFNNKFSKPFLFGKDKA